MEDTLSSLYSNYFDYIEDVYNCKKMVDKFNKGLLYYKCYRFYYESLNYALKRHMKLIAGDLNLQGYLT